MAKQSEPRSYYAPTGGHPPQTQLTTDRAVFTEAYAVIPKGVMRDIVTSHLPFWTGTRLWVLSRPLSGFAETFSQLVGKRPGLLVTSGSVGCDHHGADVAEVDGLDARNRSLGAVAPFGSLQGRCQLFGEGDEWLALDLRHALGGGLVIHAIDGLTHTGHAAFEDFVGEGLLDRR